MDSMKLFILRHGEAEIYAEQDSARQLTENGCVQSRTTGHWLAQQVAHFDLVLVSPYIRAQQTWQQLLSQAITADKVLTLDDITPDVDPEVAVSAILAYGAEAKTILVVSHLPLVSYLVEQFTYHTGPLFPTGGIAQIDDIATEQATPRGDLTTFIAPGQMASVA